ncbi:MAG: hypothetical protein LBC62_07195 [Treponema sp.]|jgi:hypothetical protein|nr:hypothetical protein [Treponema sp.]
MKLKTRTGLVFLLAAPFLFSQTGRGPGDNSAILTNAAAGVFSSPVQLEFSLSQPGSLKIAVNGEEVYLGRGPYSLELPVVPGEAKNYVIGAEYYSPPPDPVLLESRLWNIRMDPKTIYAASPEFSPKRTGAPGGKDNPFSTLEEALDYARERNLGSIMITGSLRLDKPLFVSQEILISGSPDGPGASIVFGSGAGISAGPFQEGAEKTALKLADLTLERPAGDEALFSLMKGCALEISGTSILQAGPFLSMEEGSFCRIKDSRISVLDAAERRRPVICSQQGRLEILSSAVDLAGNYGLLMEIQGGSLSSESCEFRVTAQKTAAVFILNGTTAEIRNTAASASAPDYASVMEASASELLVYRGTLEAEARDSVGILLDKSEALFIGAGFTVKASFLARAAEVRGSFPRVTDCVFVYQGRARRSEVFAGYGAEIPGEGTIGGSCFEGFSHILGNAWAAENIAAFNRSFAPSDRPNAVVKPGS